MLESFLYSLMFLNVLTKLKQSCISGIILLKKFEFKFICLLFELTNTFCNAEIWTLFFRLIISLVPMKLVFFNYCRFYYKVSII